MWSVTDGWNAESVADSLNATGDAPIYAARAFAVFNMTPNNVTGLSASRSGTTVTLTGFSTAPNLTYRAGHTIFWVSNTGTITGGTYTVTGVTDTELTFTHGTSGAASGTGELQQGTIARSGNITNVCIAGTGIGYLNTWVDVPDNPVLSGAATASVVGRGATISLRFGEAYTGASVAFNCLEQTGTTNALLTSTRVTAILS